VKRNNERITRTDRIYQSRRKDKTHFLSLLVAAVQLQRLT